MAITCEGREGHKRVIFLFKTEVYRESYQKLILKETSIILRTSLMYSTSKQLGYNKKKPATSIRKSAGLSIL